jgi:transcriptional regulator with XRE-family HTH domain
LRELAREVGGFDHGYLSRMLSRKLPVNVRHAERVAHYLGLPADYFPEVREAAVLKAIREDARLREQIYERIRKRL